MQVYSVIIILKHGRSIIKEVESSSNVNAIIDALKRLELYEKDNVAGVRVSS